MASSRRKRMQVLQQTKPIGLTRRRRTKQLICHFERLEQRQLLANSTDVSAELFKVDSDWFAEVQQVRRVELPTQVQSGPALEVYGPQAPIVAEWLVQLSADAIKTYPTPSSLSNAFDQPIARFNVIRGLGAAGTLLLQSQSYEVSDAEAALQSNSLVAAFIANGVVTSTALPNDSDFGNMTNLQNVGQFGATPDADIDAPEAWDLTRGSSSVVVGVIDSGVDASHPDLYLNMWINQGEIPAGKRAQAKDIDNDGLVTFYDLNDSLNASMVRDLNSNGYIDAHDLLDDPLWADGRDSDDNGFTDDFFGWNFRQSSNEPFAPNNPSDALGHGTHVGGTIAAIGNNGRGVTGINWRASVMALKFLDGNNQGDTASAIAAINYATMMREQFNTNVRVLNNSWGQPGGFNPLLERAIDASGDAGILFVAAAGNGNLLGQGVDNDRTPFYPASYELDNVISVGASDSKDRLAGFSNYGVRSVDIVAPGVGVRSTLPGGRYGEANGTSMATPHVAGVAALGWAWQPDATVAEIRRAILEQSDSLASLGNQISTGRRLNAMRVLNADVFAPTVELVNAANVTSSGGSEQFITVRYLNRLGVDQATLGNSDITVLRESAIDESLSTTFISATANQARTEVTAVYRLSAVGGSWDADDYGNYVIIAQADAARSLSGLPTREQTLGSFQVRISAPGIFYVDTFNDSVDTNPGDGLARDANGRTSLRAAIMEANAQAPSPIKIYLQSGTYALSIPPVIDPNVNYPVPGIGSGYEAPTGLQWSNASTGDLDLTGNITLSGLGANRTTIDGQKIDRVMKIYENSTTSILGLTVQNGDTKLNHSGGGILTRGNLSVNSVNLLNNRAASGPSSLGGGLAIWSGNAVVLRSAINSNLATSGGGIYVTNGAELEILDTTIADNTADATSYSPNFQLGGGGILTSKAANVTLTNSVLFENIAQGSALGASISNQTVTFGNTSTAPVISSDGRFVAFVTSVSALPADGDSVRDAYLLDRQTNTLELLSVNSDGIKGNADVIAVNISEDGRYVSFRTNSTNLVPNDTNDSTDVFWRDRQSGITKRVSVSTENIEANSDTGNSAISSNGKAIVTRSIASNLVPNDSNGIEDVFVHYVDSARTVRVSEPNPGVISIGGASSQNINGDGTYVVYSSSQQITADDNPDVTDVFLKDMKTGISHLVSRHLPDKTVRGTSSVAAISSDANIIAYRTTSPSIIEEKTTTLSDIVYYDRKSSTTTLVTRGYDGNPANGTSADTIISRNGRYIGFTSTASNLVPNDTNGLLDLFVYDRETGQTTMVPSGPSGADVQRMTIADVGPIVSFFSNDSLVPEDLDTSVDAYLFDASKNELVLLEPPSEEGFGTSKGNWQFTPSNNFFNTGSALVATDNNGLSDVYATDANLRPELISVAMSGQAGNGASTASSAAINAPRIVFRSLATDLVNDDINQSPDLFLRDRFHGITKRILLPSETMSDAGTFSFQIDGGGNRLAFQTVARLTLEDQNDFSDIYLYDLNTDALTLLSTSFDGLSANGTSNFPAISPDGRWVSFLSDASNLTPNDGNGATDLVMISLETGERLPVTASINFSGSGGQGQILADSKFTSSFSTNSQFLTFKFLLGTASPGSLPQNAVLIYDLQSRILLDIESDLTSITPFEAISAPRISSDGKTLAYATNIAPADADAKFFQFGVVIYDRTRQESRSVDFSFPIGNFVSAAQTRSVTFLPDDTLAFSAAFTPVRVNLKSGDLSTWERLTNPANTSVLINHSTIASNSSLPSAGLSKEVHGNILILNSINTIPPTTLPARNATGFTYTYGMPTIINSLYVDKSELVSKSSAISARFSVSSDAANQYKKTWLEPTPQDFFGSNRNRNSDLGPTEETLGTVEGKIFLDGNLNREFDQTEAGFGGIIIFADYDGDQVLDANEPFSKSLFDDEDTRVDESGNYRLANVQPGVHTVTAILPSGLALLDSRLIDKLPVTSDTKDLVLDREARIVAFTSSERGLTTKPDNTFEDVFTYDAVSGTVTMISGGLLGDAANGDSQSPVVSADGRYIAFTSMASNLVTGDTNQLRDVFLYDSVSRTTVLVSKGIAGAPANGNVVERLAISSDGSFIAYASQATNIVNGVSIPSIYVWERATGNTIALTNIPEPIITDPDTQSLVMNASFSGNFQKVTFASTSSTLVTGDTNGQRDVFLLDRNANRIRRISVSSSGEQANQQSAQPAISEDGFSVVFVSNATNLSLLDPRQDSGLYVHRLADSQTDYVATYGSTVYPLYRPSISSDGRYVGVRAYAGQDFAFSSTVFAVIDTFSGQLIEAGRIRAVPSSSFLLGDIAAISGDGSTLLFSLAMESGIPNTGTFLFGRELIAGKTIKSEVGITTEANIGVFTQPATISGRVYRDVIPNQVFDLGDAPLSGIRVFIDENGNFSLDAGEQSDVTDQLGSYSFEDLGGNREYRILSEPIADLLQTSPTSIHRVFVTPGDNVTDRDFGFVPATTGGQFENAQITGKLFNDLNRDGQQQPGEAPLVGITVYLDQNGNEVRDFDEPRTLTDNAGSYTFAGLGNRAYTVRTLLPKGTLQTSPLGSDFERSSVTLTTGSTQLANPQDVLTQDFNNDGWSDVAIALYSGNSISIRLNDQSGQFTQAPINVPIAPEGLGPIAIASGALNSGSSMDFVSANYLNGTVTALLDFQNEQFQSRQTLAVGDAPIDLVIGAFDGDTDLDVVVANQTSDQLTLLVNNGNGVFTRSASIASGGKRPTALVSGRFNSDAFLDLAVANFGTHPSGTDLGNVAILLGNGDGTFRAPTSYSVGFGPLSIASDDLNGDGFADLVTANFLANTASILYGSANGLFTVANQQLSTGQGPLQVLLQDIEGDGDRDIYVTNLLSQTISVLRNRQNQGGNGFEPAENFGVAEFSTAPKLAFAVADFDRSGTSDIALVNSLSDSLTLMKNSLVDGAHRVQLTGVESIANLNFGTRAGLLLPTLDAISTPSPILEDAGEQLVNLTGIAPGRTGGPALQISASSSAPLIIPDPTVTFVPGQSTAVIRYRPLADMHGQVTIVATVRDAGVDTVFNTLDDALLQRSFTVTVQPVNDPPTLSLPPSRTVNIDEDSGAQSIAAFVTNFSTGGGTLEASQTLSPFIVTADNPSLFSALPTIDSNGRLTFTAKPDATGTTSVAVTIKDNGGASNGGSDSVSDLFVLVINPINDAPSINIGGNQNVATGGGAQSVTSFATGFAPGGGTDEASQTITEFVVTSDNPGLFLVQPSISAVGTLSYTPALERTGVANVTVRVRDNGGTAKGGADLSPPKSFVVTVAAVLDTTAPRPVLRTQVASQVNQRNFPVSIDFGENVANFALTDLTVSGGSVSNLQSLPNGLYSFTFTALADGNVSIGLAADKVKDLANNGNLAATPLNIVIDTVGLIPALSTTEKSVTNQETFSVTAIFGGAVTDFDVSDITVVNGTPSNLQTVDAAVGRYAFDVTVDSRNDGPVTVLIPSGRSVDSFGNFNNNSNVINLIVDRSHPTAALSPGLNSLINQKSFSVQVDFSEPVTGFDLSDLNLTNGTSSVFQQLSASRYTFLFTADGEGPIAIGLAAGKAQDAAGNTNTAANSLQSTFDGTPPLPSLTSSQTSPVTTTDLVATVTFSEPISGFDANDVFLINGTLQSITPANNQKYDLKIKATGDGVVVIGLVTGGVQDAATNPSVGVLPLTLTVDQGSANYTPAISSSEPTPTLNRSFDATIDFGRAITGLTSDDFSTTNATVTSVSEITTGRYRIALNVLSEGTYSILFGANKVLDGQNRPNSASNTLTGVYVDLSNSDFGDAPTAAQSGFETSYPTRFSDNGARHKVTSLFLGAGVDAETDGQPSATGTGDEAVGSANDGISFLVTPIASSRGATFSLLQVNASGSGKLDGWIDLNRDGDWNDAGEQIVINQAITSGNQLVFFTIPIGASPGVTFARFRLSTAGGLSPIGPASDGEVEDYRVTLLDGAAGANVSVDAVATGNASIDVTAGEVRVYQGNTSFFRGAVGDVAKIEVQSQGNTLLSITNPGVNLPGTIDYVTTAGAIDATLRVTQSNIDLGGLAGQSLVGIDKIDLTAAKSSLNITATDVNRITGGSTLRIITDGDDMITAETGWKYTTAIKSNNRFVPTFQNGTAQVEIVTSPEWHNPFNGLDASGDGSVTTLDALLVINALNGPRVMDGQGVFFGANQLDVLDYQFYDTDGDGKLAPLDALIVINELNRRPAGEPTDLLWRDDRCDRSSQDEEELIDEVMAWWPG